MNKLHRNPVSKVDFRRSSQVANQSSTRKPLKKLCIILITLLAFCSFTAKAQDQFTKRKLVVKAFIAAVFEEKKDARFIIDNYMHLQSTEVELPMVKKEDIIRAMIDTLVKPHGKLLSSSPYKILKYADFKGSKKPFINDENQDIMIVAVDNEPILYLTFYQDRILSFSTFNKGSLTFFAVI